jgi:hypothetical protein
MPRTTSPCRTPRPRPCPNPAAPRSHHRRWASGDWVTYEEAIAVLRRARGLIEAFVREDLARCRRDAHGIVRIHLRSLREAIAGIDGPPPAGWASVRSTGMAIRCNDGTITRMIDQGEIPTRRWVINGSLATIVPVAAARSTLAAHRARPPQPDARLDHDEPPQPGITTPGERGRDLYLAVFGGQLVTPIAHRWPGRDAIRTPEEACRLYLKEWRAARRARAKAEAR